jgi:cytochrome b pre-mRNA-processing protein 3
MLNWLFRRDDNKRRAADLYGAVVTLARRPALYESIGIADTPEGRYEALVLYLFLVLERMKGEGAQAAPLSQALLETFVTDMDDNMREMGVGDLSVPRKVKKAAAAFYDRAEVYRAAIASGPEDLAAALARLVPARAGQDLDAGALARDVMEQVAQLAGTPLDTIADGR